jgi:hypothetical protein
MTEVEKTKIIPRGDLAMDLILPRSVRRRIRRLAKKTRDADQRVRCLLVLKVAEGKSRRAAARELGCVPSTAWTTPYSAKIPSAVTGRCQEALPARNVP